MVFITENWTLELKQGWISEIGETIYTFYNPKGFGALQISEYIKDSIIKILDILEFIEEEDLPHVHEIKYGDFKGLQLIYNDENNMFCRKWWLVNNTSFLFVTYNCGLENKDEEKNIVDGTLSSLKYLKK